ncbi:MAG: hypothetical protein AABY10_05360, partial [Nanoarchaeota archaeon]
MEKAQSKLAKYQVVPRNVDLSIVRTPTFPEGQFGQDFLEAYNERVAKDFDNNPVLNVFNYDAKNRMVTGSNPYAAVLANQI